VCVALKDGDVVLTAVVLVQVPDWSKDNAAGRKILQHHDLEVFESPLHLEGGSIHSDGQGCVLSNLPHLFPPQSFIALPPMP